MADVRALLRNERLSRRITHPNATYSTAGTLSCNICNLRLQAEALWEPHLSGKVHKQNVSRIHAAKQQAITQSKQSADESIQQTAAAAANLAKGNINGKKRKADDEGDEDVVAQQVTGKKRKAVDSGSEGDIDEGAVSKKKARSSLEDGPSASVSTEVVENGEDTLRTDANVTNATIAIPDTASGGKPIDEDEYAAFEAAIAAAPAEDDEMEQSMARNVLNSGADIAAAPITAAELASREIEDANAQQRGKREEEMEGEKEDAARALEEEFDEMDQLEARVKRLKEMRERIRLTSIGEVAAVEDLSGEGMIDTLFWDPSVREMTDVLYEELDYDEDDEDDNDHWDFG